jgi:hypothetical protein
VQEMQENEAVRLGFVQGNASGGWPGNLLHRAGGTWRSCCGRVSLADSLAGPSANP